MGKLKTHKGTAKRFKITGRGKILHSRTGRRHLMTGKRAKRTRTMRKPLEVQAVDAAKIRALLPYQ